MELQVVGANALTVSETTFGREFNEALIHRCCCLCSRCASRYSCKKTRAEVSGSGKKPWRQKVQIVLVLVILNHQSGVLVVQPSRLNHKITAKSEQENVPWCYQKHSF